MEVVAGTEPDESCAVALTQTVRHARFAAEAQTLRKTKAPSCEGDNRQSDGVAEPVDRWI